MTTAELRRLNGRVRESVALVNAPARAPSGETRSRQVLGPVALTSITAVVCSAVTLLVIFIPGLHFAYRSVRGHLVLETFDACAAGAVTLLFYGRYQRTCGLSDLRMALAFFLLTMTGAFLILLPLDDASRGPVASVWFPLCTRLVAASLVALASVSGDRRAERTFRAGHWFVAAGALFVALAMAALVSPTHLSQPVDATISPSLSGRPLFVGNGPIEFAQIVHALLYATAAVAFTRRAARTGDAMLRWLGVGCTLAAAARVNYFLFPSLYSEWLYTGDVLRTGFYLALIVGGIREVQGYWLTQAEAAVFAERRRLARDLHDGTVQELGYIRALARGLAREAPATPSAERIAAAAERALAEARHAIEALTLPLDEPLGDLIRRAASEIADRYDVDVTVDAVHGVSADHSQREALVRIVREAVSNAARHGQATHVRIDLGDGCIEISDDGTGFDLGHTGSGGFGLVSMRDRADAMQAAMDIQSSPKRGTTVKVMWHASQ